MPQRFWLAFLWAACASAQSIQGTVVNSATGNGIPGVKVELIWSGDPAYDGVTDTQGHFRFEHVQAGAYTMSYTLEGYEWVGFLQRPQEPRIYRATAGNTVEIVAHMMPMGRLSGRVLDSEGKPVPKAPVEYAGPGVQMNFPADADGKFQVDKFAFPGAYTISAIPPAGFHAPASPPGDDRVFAWTRTWYPGTTEREAAGKIVLAPGGSFDNIELKLRAAPAHAVRGRLLNPDGKPAAKVEIALSSSKGLFKTKSGDDGQFEFSAVDGEWRLSAEAQSSFLNAKLRAAQAVAIAGRDREGVKLQLDAPIAVRLRAIAETSPDSPAPRFAPGNTVLVAVDPSGLGLLGDRVLAQPQPDGTYSLSGVYPRSYRIEQPNPSGYYLAAIRLGETPVAGRVVDLTAGATVTLVFRADGGTVRGTVENCASGGVLLVPQDASLRDPGAIRRTECDAAGRYEFAAVRPASYYAISAARDPSSFFWDQEWDDSLIRQAASVSVGARETVTLDLRAAARP